MDEDFQFITLKCRHCENVECDITPLGSWVPDIYKTGCTRKVTEDQAAQYYHYINEVNLRTLKTKEGVDRIYNEILDFFNIIYSCPLGNVLDKQGKIKNKI